MRSQGSSIEVEIEKTRSRHKTEFTELGKIVVRFSLPGPCGTADYGRTAVEKVIGSHGSR